MAVLIAHHDNGWDTHVVETAGGDYMAWAAPAGARGLTRYVEFDIAAAKACAASHLVEQSGHQRCSGACTPWQPEVMEGSMSLGTVS